MRYAIFLIVTVNFCAQVSWAQPETSGHIQIEGNLDAKGGYSETLNKTIQYFKDLAALTTTLAGGGGQPAPVLDDNMMQIMDATYLHCASQRGACPGMLDTILETDLISSVLSGEVACPNMTKFWRLWLSDDMEQRHNYLINIGQLTTKSEFNSNERPKYIRCKDTLQTMIGSSSKESFFKSRYPDGAPIKQSINETIGYLEQVKEKIGNIFVATGAGDFVNKDNSGAKDVKSSGKPQPAPKRPAAAKPATRRAIK